MGIFYVLTVIAMLIAFMLIRKKEEKANFISWCVITAICYLGYNIFVCMLFGVLNITTNLLFLSVINLIVTGLIGIKIYLDKKIQNYEFKIKDFIAIFIIFVIVAYISIKQYKPLAKIVANASVDISMHYSAATNFANNMKVLSKIDNQTGYNFKTMQTGAYINSGIMINTVRSVLPEFKDYITFKIFDVLIFALSISAFYVLISDKLKTKLEYVTGMILLCLYAFAFPYTSLLYGFSYLSVSIVFVTGLLIAAKFYRYENLKFIYALLLILLNCIGIIFSYCLFVPATFAFICIYMFIADFNKKEEKKIFKIFGKNTLITTGILLLLTVFAICYLVIPTFTDSDQNKLTDAIGFDGQIYKALYQDFLFYIPFIVLFIYRAIKCKKIDYKLVAFLLILGQTLACFAGLIIGFVSPYYYYKMYYILWILSVAIAIDVMCDLKENRETQIMLTGYLVTWCLVIMCALAGSEIKLAMKVPNLIDNYKSQAFAGIYFDSNILAVNNIDVSCIVNTNRIEIAEEMGKIEGITLKNMLVGGMNTNSKAWIYVLSGIPSGGEKIDDLQVAVVETSIKDWMAKEDKEYFVLFDESNNYESNEEYKVLFKNEAGVILQKVK